MVYNIKKNQVSNYPNPIIPCTVQCFRNESDMDDEQKVVYWIPFQVPLIECRGLTREQIDEKIKAQGEALFKSPEMQDIFTAIEIGFTLDTSEVI